MVSRKTPSLFDQTENNSQTMLAQEARSLELKIQLDSETDQAVRVSLQKEIFEIEKYCQAVNMLRCGGV